MLAIGECALKMLATQLWKPKNSSCPFVRRTGKTPWHAFTFTCKRIAQRTCETEKLIAYFRSRSLMPKNRFSGYTCSVLCILRCSIIELSTWIEIVLGKVVVQCLVCWFCFWGAQWCQILLATTKEFLDKVCEISKEKHKNEINFQTTKR